MKRVLVIAACVSFVFGCGGDTTTSTATTPAAGCAAVAEALCMRLNACTNGLTITAPYGDVATCVRRTTLGCTTGAALPGASLTGAALQSCASAAMALTCDQLFSGSTPSACDLPGTLAAGAACSIDVQCQSRYCARTSSAGCGACAARPAVGTSCANGLGCGPTGLVCGSSATCVQPAAEGAACSPMLPCGPALTCAGGTCRRPPSTVGAACDAMTGCQLSVGLYCDSMTRMCTAFTYAPAGQMCGVVGGRLVGCSNSSCQGAMGLMRPGTCTAYAGDNAPCNTESGPRCQGPSECIPTTGMSGAGTCRLPGAATCR